jgi:hypothetical protein
VLPSNGQNQLIPPAQRNNTKPVRRTTGPRTPAGKPRSKYNARIHGIFSCVGVLPGESWQDYKSFWNGLRDYFQPGGKAEEILVEEMAMNRWRY